MIEGNDKKSTLGPAAGMTAIAGGLAGMAFGIDPEYMSTMLQGVAGNQIAQAGFFFTVAAWLHSGRVKKEISKNFSSITDAINNVANALGKDLERQAKILAHLTKRVDNLEKKSGITEDTTEVV